MASAAVMNLTLTRQAHKVAASNRIDETAVTNALALGGRSFAYASSRKVLPQELQALVRRRKKFEVRRQRRLEQHRHAMEPVSIASVVVEDGLSNSTFVTTEGVLIVPSNEVMVRDSVASLPSPTSPPVVSGR